MDGGNRRSRQFELASGLQRDGAAAGHVRQADDMRPLHDRFPAEQQLHPFEERPDAARTLIRHRRIAGEHEGEFFVLSADTKPLARFFAGRKPRNEFVTCLDRRDIVLVARHES